jgi:hypothetical protein
LRTEADATVYGILQSNGAAIQPNPLPSSSGLHENTMRASDQAEAVVVLWWDFETAVRDSGISGADVNEKIDNLAGRFPRSMIDKAHQVRMQRNAFIHYRTPIPSLSAWEADCRYVISKLSGGGSGSGFPWWAWVGGIVLLISAASSLTPNGVLTARPPAPQPQSTQYVATPGCAGTWQTLTTGADPFAIPNPSKCVIHWRIGNGDWVDLLDEHGKVIRTIGNGQRYDGPFNSLRAASNGRATLSYQLIAPVRTNYLPPSTPRLEAPSANPPWALSPGRWEGTIYPPSGDLRRPITFELNLHVDGNSIFAQTSEWGPAVSGGAFLHAYLSGTISGSNVSFTKTYYGLAGFRSGPSIT